MEPISEIPQRELRNNVGEVLRRVASGERLRITVRGKPVAELVPVADPRPHLVSWSVVERIRREHPLDPGFKADVDDMFWMGPEDLGA